MRLSNRSFILSLALACGALVATSSVSAQQSSLSHGSALTSDAVIHRAGLQVEWSSQAPVGVVDRLIDWELFVNEDEATTTFEVTAGNRREIISQFDRDARGDLLGIDGAEQQAKIRRDYLVALLTARGNKEPQVRIQRFQKPTSTIYLMTNEGAIAALDADSGKTHWVSQIGNFKLNDLPGIGLGVDKNHVAAVRGSTLHLLEATTGKELWSKPCKYAAGSSPAVTDKQVMVPLTDGRLEVFTIAAQGLGSHALMALGEGTAQPLVTATSVSWPTTRGELNVMMRDNKKHAISYRLRSDDAIVSSPTYGKGTLFVGSLDGFLYAIDEDRGSTIWEVSLGTGISKSPVPLGDFVYAVSNDDKLFKIEAATGRLAAGWENPLSGVQQFAGAGKENLYVLDQADHMLTVDPASKAVISRVPVGHIELVLNNYQTDRMYVASKSGVLQCLREVASERPYFHGDETTDKMSAGSATKQMPAEGSDSKMTPGSDARPAPMEEPDWKTPMPADEGANPFGGGSSDDADPFSSDAADPFGGGSATDEDADESGDDVDPFG